MNDLLTESLRENVSQSTEHNPGASFRSIAVSSGGANLDKFFADVNVIKEELESIERLHTSLHEAFESSKTLHESKQIEALRMKMDDDVASCLKKAKVVKVKLEALDRANAANRAVEGCGPGSSTDRTRVSVVNGLKGKLKHQMEAFQDLRKEIGDDYKQTLQRRYYTVTGENPTAEMIETLMSTGEGDKFFQLAIDQQGRGSIIDTIEEVQERHLATTELKKSLLELQQVFMDMSVLVLEQGEQLDDIESQLQTAKSYIDRGNEQLLEANKKGRSTRKWSILAIVLVVVVVLIILLPILLKK